jgi:uncharacterized UPF0160 family protein
MPHQETKSELVTPKTISEMKFSKENFKWLQELNTVQLEQIKTIDESLKEYQEVTRQLKNLILKKESSITYLDSIIKLRDKKVTILNKKIKYLKFRRTIEITVNDVKNAE